MWFRDLSAFARVGWGALALGAGVLLAPSPGRAFLILAVKGEPCHEKMMLGTLDRVEEPFANGGDLPMETLLQAFAARAASATGYDSATEGFVRENSQRFGLSHLPFQEQVVLASFVAGVRAPDTEGLSIIDVNKIREVHIEDDQQADHFLRRSTVDHEAWETETISEATRQIKKRVEGIRQAWAEPGPALARVRWTFPFYGEADVSVFAPAYELGRVAHIIQDSYAHTVRDEEFRILAIANYVDVINENHSEERDGPAHSVRLDRCDVGWNAFDRMRVVEASRSVSEVLDEAYKLLLDPSRDLTTLDAIFGAIFSFRSGCGLSNGYCDSSWYRIAQEDVTKPFSVAVCGTVPKRWMHGANDPPLPPGGSALAILPFAGALMIFVWLRFKRAGALALLFFLVSIAPHRAHAFEDPTGGKPFADWLWNDQFIPTAKTGFDRPGKQYYAGAAVATVIALNYDEDVRQVFRRNKILPEELSHAGSLWGSGFPGIAIATTQLFVDPKAGLVHGRALALTSLNHITLALITRRSRPNEGGRVSFPSGHTASAFATATALTYSYGWPVGLPAYFMAGLVGTARLQDDVHFMSDVFAAAALGIFWGRASALMDRRERESQEANGALVSRTQISPVLMDGGIGVVLLKDF